LFDKPGLTPLRFYNFNNLIILCSRGGKINDNGRDAKKPNPQPINQGLKKSWLKPTLMAVITRDIHMDITVAMQKPKNNI
jgi:hypothetical protein